MARRPSTLRCDRGVRQHRHEGRTFTPYLNVDAGRYIPDTTLTTAQRRM